MTLYENNIYIYIYIDNSHNFNAISAWINTVSCFYRPPDYEHLFVRNMLKII